MGLVEDMSNKLTTMYDEKQKKKEDKKEKIRNYLTCDEAFEFWRDAFGNDIMEVQPLLFFDKFKDYFNDLYMPSSKKISDPRVFLEVLTKELDTDSNGIILATEFNDFFQNKLSQNSK